VLSDRDDRIRKLVELMPAGVCTCDAEGRLTFYNRRAMELWGREPNVGKENKFCGSFRMWTPDGSLLRHEDCPMADAVLRGHSARNREIVIEQPTAARLVASMNVDPLRDREGPGGGHQRLRRHYRPQACGGAVARV
jgi:PAS domain-containing protein